MNNETVVRICAKECGASCCSGDIYVGRGDTRRLREGGHGDFVDTGTPQRTMQTDENGDCRFLGEDNRCTVYDDRPIDCQLFPLGMNVIDDTVEIVLVGCPLSNMMNDTEVSGLVVEAKSIISNYTRADLYAYDELSFSGEYTVLETVPIADLYLAETA
jgi:Fe-S-cluster containining protein